MKTPAQEQQDHEENENKTNNSVGQLESNAPVHKKAAFYVAKGVRAMGNHRVNVNVDWDRYYRNAADSAVGKSAASAWKSTKNKTNEGVRWARTYSEEVSGDGVTHRRGESFLRTEKDLRQVFHRGDLITIDNETFMVSSNENDEFSASRIPLTSPKHGRNPGIRKGQTASHSGKIKRVGDRINEALEGAPSIDAKGGFAVVGKAGEAVAGAAVLGAQKAKSKTQETYNKARYYEEACGTIRSNGSSLSVCTEENQNNHLTLCEVDSILEEIPNCLVTQYLDENNAESTSSLVGILSRGDCVVIEQEKNVVAQSYIRRFHASQLPLEKKRVNPSAELVPIFKYEVYRNCVAIGTVSQMKTKSSTATLSEDVNWSIVEEFINDSVEVVIGAEKFSVIKKGNRELKLDSIRQSQSVSNVPLYVNLPFNPNEFKKVPGVLVTLLGNEMTAGSTGSLEKFLSRGDSLYIGGNEYKVSLNLLKRYTSTQVPLDRVLQGEPQTLVPVYVRQNNVTSSSTARKKLQRGDRIRIGVNGPIYRVSSDPSREFDPDATIPLSEDYVDNGEQGNVQEVEAFYSDANSPATIFFMGDRVQDATVKTSAAAHRTASYKEAVGDCSFLRTGTTLCFTTADLRKHIKRGDKVTINGETFIISHEGEYSRDVLTLDHPYVGESISISTSNRKKETNERSGEIIQFEHGSNKCYTTEDLSSRVHKGDGVLLARQNYVVDAVTSTFLTLTKVNSGPSIYKEPQVVKDCLVSLEMNSKNAQSSASALHSIHRGDDIIIGGERYTVATSILRRFTSSQIPLEQARKGQSVEMEDLIHAEYLQDSSIFLLGSGIVRSDSSTATTTPVDNKIYRHGDRLDEYGRAQERRVVKETLVWRQREKNMNNEIDNMKEVSKAKISDLDDYVGNQKDRMQPGLDKASDGARMAAGAVYIAGSKTVEKTQPHLKKMQPHLEEMQFQASRKIDKTRKEGSRIVKDIKDGMEDGVDAGTGPVKRHQVNLNFKVKY